MGYSDAVYRIKSNNEEETAITGYITNAIKNRMRDINCPSWCKYYFIQDDPPLESEGRTGKRRRRADIIIESNISGRPEFIFEAKRLRKNGYGIDKYIGEDGMGCFINGIYGARYDEVAMLGYIQSDSLVFWKTNISHEIEKNNKILELDGYQQDISVISDLPLEWISTHKRKGITHSVRIYHILLDCIGHTMKENL
jgi:hypothetical protein